MEPRMRSECFARPRWVEDRVECDAVHACPSRPALKCEGCGFYKDEAVNAAELMQYNGTDDVDVAVAMYCLEHTDEPKKLKEARKIVRAAAGKYPAVGVFWAKRKEKEKEEKQK